MGSKAHGWFHRRRREALLAENLVVNDGLCYWCGERPATVADHDPPLYLFADHADWEGVYRASCRKCSDRQGQAVATLLRNDAKVRPDEVRTRNWLP